MITHEIINMWVWPCVLTGVWTWPPSPQRGENHTRQLYKWQLTASDSCINDSFPEPGRLRTQTKSLVGIFVIRVGFCVVIVICFVLCTILLVNPALTCCTCMCPFTWTSLLLPSEFPVFVASSSFSVYNKCSSDICSFWPLFVPQWSLLLSLLWPVWPRYRPRLSILPPARSLLFVLKLLK